MGFKSVFKTMFPFISAASGLGGPLGIMAASAVGNALGIEKVDPADLEGAITKAQIKDPDALVKLQTAEQDFKLQMEKLGLDSAARLEEIAAEDRSSARAREVAVRDKIPAILAISITGGFFGLLALLLFRGVPADSLQVVGVMTGSLGTAWVGIVTYYFGSSRGSADKSRIIGDIAQTK